MPAMLEKAAPSSLDLDPKALERLHEAITRHVAEGRYPGAQYAVARHGKLAVASTIGDARTDPAPALTSLVRSGDRFQARAATRLGHSGS